MKASASATTRRCTSSCASVNLDPSMTSSQNATDGVGCGPAQPPARGAYPHDR
jgi:hypothetical protein